MHVLFCALAFSFNDKYSNICNKSDTIIRFHHLMLQIVAKNEYVYEQWKQVITQMIEKNPGCPNFFASVLSICMNVIWIYLLAFIFEHYNNTTKTQNFWTMDYMENFWTNKQSILLLLMWGITKLMLQIMGFIKRKVGGRRLGQDILSVGLQAKYRP